MMGHSSKNVQGVSKILHFPDYLSVRTLMYPETSQR